MINNQKIDCNDLVFTILSTRETYDFAGKYVPLFFLSKIRNGEITIEKAKEKKNYKKNYKKKLIVT